MLDRNLRDIHTNGDYKDTYILRAHTNKAVWKYTHTSHYDKFGSFCSYYLPQGFFFLPPSCSGYKTVLHNSALRERFDDKSGLITWGRKEAGKERYKRRK